MLKPDKFIDAHKGRKEINGIINLFIEEQGGKFKEDAKEEHRKTWYKDTKQHDLNKKNKFLLRIREEWNKDGSLKEYDVTLKNRHPDRYMAASYDLSNPVEKPNFIFKNDSYKFEEDITTSGYTTSLFNSKFSSSAKFEYKQKPDLNTFEDIISIYPNLKSLDISPKEKLWKVNDFEAIEHSYDLGKILFEDGNKAKTQLSLWYLSNKDILPIIAEFDIDLESNKPSQTGEMLLEEFSLPLIVNIYKLYIWLQNESIADPNASKTKTEYVYNYKK